MWLILFLILGCGEKNKPAPAAPVRVPEVTAAAVPASPERGVTKTAELPEVTTELLPLEVPGEYQVRVRWKAGGLLGEEWWVQRIEEGGQSRVLGRVPRDQREFLDPEKLLPRKYFYRILSYEEGKGLELGTAKVEVPSDWLATAGDHPWPELPYGRWFLEKGARVRNGSTDREARLLELHSDGGVIETFPEGAKAPPGENGKAGGHIKLEIGRATGSLEIFCRGENGGDGISGSEGAPGKAGVDAFGGEYFRFPIDFGLVLPLRGDDGKVRVPVFDGYYERQPPIFATDGGNGGRGGDAKGISLQVADSEQFVPRPLSIAGLGGREGPGGRGGRGGAGGFGASAHPLNPLGASIKANGHVGTPGPDGRPGLAGANGRVFSSRIQLGKNDRRFD
jgi:hypothetical protein